VCKKGQGERAPPMAPGAFAMMLESGVESGEVRFTRQGDVPVVTAIHDKAFMTEMHVVAKLNYSGLSWGDAAGATLCEALRYAHAHGGLTKLKQLYLGDNQLGDPFVASLVALLDEGALATLEHLDLKKNAISDEGMQQLAAAIARGQLTSCTKLLLKSCRVFNAHRAASVAPQLATPAAWDSGLRTWAAARAPDQVTQPRTHPIAAVR